MNLAVSAPAIPLIHVDQRERTRRTVVNLVLSTYVLLVIEGALRKWALEPLHKALFFIRDPFVLLSLWLCLRERLMALTPLTVVVLVFAVAFLFLGGAHIIMHNLSPVAVAFGWRNYFFYLFFALIMAAVMQRSDVERMIRLSLLMAMPMAVLAFVQWRSPADAWINRQIGGGEVFTVAQGVVRTSGTFTFTAGFVCFTGATLACLAAAAFSPRMPRWLVACGAAAAATCLATSGARMAFMHAGLTGVMAFACEAVRPIASQRIIVHAGVLLMTVGLAGGLALFYPQAIELMVERTQTASQHEDSTKRLVWTFLAGLLVGEEAGLFGLGLGLGTGGGSVAATGNRTFTLAEDEFPRVVLESGLILGLGYMVLRYAICGWLLWQSVRCIRARRDAVPLMLCSFTAPLLLIGQITLQGSINGYGWMFTGLTLAAISSSKELDDAA
jgi:hypothetical protein